MNDISMRAAGVRVGRSPSVRFVITADGGVLMDTSRGIIFSLNPTGGVIWEYLATASDPVTIAARLAQETGADPLQVADDVDAFLRDLLQRELIIVAESHAV